MIAMAAQKKEERRKKKNCRVNEENSSFVFRYKKDTLLMEFMDARVAWFSAGHRSRETCPYDEAHNDSSEAILYSHNL